MSKYVGRNSRAWVERATQLFLCTAVSSADHRLHLFQAVEKGTNPFAMPVQRNIFEFIIQKIR